MKKTKKILTVFAVFLYLISFAYAQDYSLFSGKFYDLKLEKETDKVCGGINKKYKGELINNGNQKSDVELTAKGPNWVSIDKNNFSVAANGKQEFELNADIPANAKGIFDVIVNAAIGNLPSIKSEKKLSIHVVPKYDCYKPDILTDEKITNYYSNSYVPVKIRNSGIKKAIYEIGIEPPNWINIDSKKIILNPGQTANLNLNINPDAEAPEGIYPIKISLKFEYIAYSKDIAVFLTKENKFFKELKSFFIFYKFYFISGILISLFIIFLIEFYRPLFKLLKSIDKPKRKR